MLNFFRKYQKVFFIFITVVIVFSFSFFGTYSALLGSQNTVEDKTIGQTPLKKPIKESEVSMMSRFLTTDIHTGAQRQIVPNLFNDGVLLKDFFHTGIAQLLVQEHFDELKEEIEIRWKRAQKYVPYQHPQAPYISAETVWSYFSPEIMKTLQAIKEEKECTPKSFELLAYLYMQQINFSAEQLKRILFYQQKQYPNIQMDPKLYHEDLCLFGFQTAGDWFSQKFLNLLSFYIINISSMSAQDYKVGSMEAKIDLVKNMQQFLARVEDQELNTHEIYKNQLRVLGLDEKNAVKIWQTILLFRKAFDAVSDSVFIDPMTFSDYEAYASHQVDVNHFSLPETLHFKNYLDLFRFEVYKKAVYGTKDDWQNPLALEEIKKKYPSLVCKKYTIELSIVDLKKAALGISLKDMWDWQTQDENWNTLVTKFPAISAKSLKSKSERLRTLDEQDLKLRHQIDAFSREAFLMTHREVVLKELEKAPVKTMDLNISSDHQLSLPFVKDPKKFIQLLSSVSLKGEEPFDDAQKKAIRMLSAYSDNDQVYAKVAVLQREEEEHVLPFEKALSTLDPLLTQTLEDHYPHARTQNPNMFKDEKGEFKNLYEVKEEVGKIVFKEVLQKIKTQTSSNDLYAYRFYSYMNDALKDIQKNPDSNYIADHHDSLDTQFKVVKKEETLAHSDQAPIQSYTIENKEGLCFFEILKTRSSDAKDSKALDGSLNMLKMEAKKNLAASLFEEMKQKAKYELR